MIFASVIFLGLLRHRRLSIVHGQMLNWVLFINCRFFYKGIAPMGDCDWLNKVGC